jgi:hypothetical protein
LELHSHSSHASSHAVVSEAECIRLVWVSKCVWFRETYMSSAFVPAVSVAIHWRIECRKTSIC